MKEKRKKGKKDWKKMKLSKNKTEVIEQKEKTKKLNRLLYHQ